MQVDATHFYREAAVKAILRHGLSLLQKHNQALLNIGWRKLFVRYMPDESKAKAELLSQGNVSAFRIREHKLRAKNRHRQSLYSLNKLRMRHVVSVINSQFQRKKQAQISGAFARWRMLTEAGKRLQHLATFRAEMTTSHHRYQVEIGQLHHAQKRLALAILRIRALEQQYAASTQEFVRQACRVEQTAISAANLLDANKRHLGGSISEFVSLKRDADAVSRGVRQLKFPVLLGSSIWPRGQEQDPVNPFEPTANSNTPTNFRRFEHVHLHACTTPKQKYSGQSLGSPQQPPRTPASAVQAKVVLVSLEDTDD